MSSNIILNQEEHIINHRIPDGILLSPLNISQQRLRTPPPLPLSPPRLPPPLENIPRYPQSENPDQSPPLLFNNNNNNNNNIIISKNKEISKCNDKIWELNKYIRNLHKYNNKLINKLKYKDITINNYHNHNNRLYHSNLTLNRFNNKLKKEIDKNNKDKYKYLKYYNTLSKRYFYNKNNNCPICFNNISFNDASIIINCSHIYCSNCINKHVNINKKNGKTICPICKDKFTDDKLKKMNNLL